MWCILCTTPQFFYKEIHILSKRTPKILRPLVHGANVPCRKFLLIVYSKQLSLYLCQHYLVTLFFLLRWIETVENGISISQIVFLMLSKVENIFVDLGHLCIYVRHLFPFYPIFALFDFDLLKNNHFVPRTLSFIFSPGTVVLLIVSFGVYLSLFLIDKSFTFFFFTISFNHFTHGFHPF